MKKFLFSILVVSGLFTASCTDINVNQVPTVQNPNSNYQLEYRVSFYQPYTTTPLGNRFTYTLDKSKNEIFINDIIHVDSKCEMRPTARVVNGGKDIEITYRDESPSGSISVGTTKDVEMKHYFDVLNYGMGSGKTINVRINYVFPNPALGSNQTELKTISF